MINMPKSTSYIVMSDSEYDSDSSVSSFEAPVEVQSGGKKASKKTTTKKVTSKKSSKKSSKKASKKGSKASKKTSKKSSKKASKKASKKGSNTSKKTSKQATKTKAKKTKSKGNSDKPKRELNPIMKRMNVLRNEHIGSHIGTKAPMKTIPPFKLVMADARKHFKLGEKDKNTVEVVDKAIEMFDASPTKYCKD